jgi:hypothetical protein
MPTKVLMRRVSTAALSTVPIIVRSGTYMKITMKIVQAHGMITIMDGVVGGNRSQHL